MTHDSGGRTGRRPVGPRHDSRLGQLLRQIALHEATAAVLELRTQQERSDMEAGLRRHRAARRRHRARQARDRLATGAAHGAG